MKATLRLALVFTLGFSTLSLSAAEKAPDKAKTDSTAKATKEKKEKADKPAEKKKNTYPLYGEVVAVSPRILTIKGGKDKEDRKFAITTDTVIHNDDKPAKADDIKVGKWVGGYVEKADSGNDKLLKLNLGAKQKDDKPAEKKDKKADDKPKADTAAPKKKAA